MEVPPFSTSRWSNLRVRGYAADFRPLSSIGGRPDIHNLFISFHPINLPLLALCSRTLKFLSALTVSIQLWQLLYFTLVSLGCWYFYSLVLSLLTASIASATIQGAGKLFFFIWIYVKSYFGHLFSICGLRYILNFKRTDEYKLVVRTMSDIFMLPVEKANLLFYGLVKCC